ncbi:hypothetical protein JW916_15125 [Candidatus Sumerlaeota bacterium]|nr:hypothetical protein [Candidatus Sumerlaeota bacterium]
MTWILLAVLALLLLPYVLGPILVFFTVRFRMPVEIVPVDFERQPLPEGVRPYFDSVHQALTQEGFEPAGAMYLPALVPNTKSLLAVYVNRATCDTAMSTIIVAANQFSTIQTKYVEYIRRYSDDIVIQTNNSPQSGSFKPMPGEHTTRFRAIDDLHRLFQLHKFLVEKYKRGGRPVLRLDSEFHGDAARYVARAGVEESLEDQTKAGYMARVPEGFRPTPKGAFIMTWNELWPLKGLRQSRADRHADEVIQEFDRSARVY